MNIPNLILHPDTCEMGDCKCFCLQIKISGSWKAFWVHTDLTSIYIKFMYILLKFRDWMWHFAVNEA